MACRIARGGMLLGRWAVWPMGKLESLALEFQGLLREPPKFWQLLCVLHAVALGEPDLGKRGYGFLCGRQ